MNNDRGSASTLESRLPVWEALATLWLDQQVDDAALDHLAQTLASCAYTWSDIERIYRDEVLPVVHRNLSISGAWVWAGFDSSWLAAQCTRQMDQPRPPRWTQWWLMRKHRRLIREHWTALARRVDQIRRAGAASR